MQKQRKADFLEKTGKPMPKDSIVLGSAYRKAGIMTAYDPSREEDAVDDDRGLGAWQDRKNWHIVSRIGEQCYRMFTLLSTNYLSLAQNEWEERRVKRLAALAALGGVASPKAHIHAEILNE